MPFPAANGTAFPLTLDVAWSQARTIAAQVQLIATNMATAAQAAPVPASVIVGLPGQLSAYAATLTTIAAVPGIAAYAQGQVNNPSLDVAGAFNAMLATITATISWIVQNFPKDVNGNLLYQQFSTGGQITYTSFTVAQLEGFVTQLQALAATID